MNLENKHLFILELKFSPPIFDLNGLLHEYAYIKIIIVRQK